MRMPSTSSGQKRALKTLKTQLGRTIRDIARKIKGHAPLEDALR